MPSEKKPSTPAWKKSATGKESAAPAKTSAKPAWKQSGKAPEVTKARSTRNLKLFGGLGAFLVISGLIVYLIYWLVSVKPAYVVLLGADYDDNLAVPHNVYGWEGLNEVDELTKLQTEGISWLPSGKIRKNHEPRQLLAGPDWDRGLDGIPERCPVIVYLAMHGGADEKGGYFLFNDVDLRDANLDRHKLRLDKVLERLKALPEKQRKLLILDATQFTSHWPLGMLHNDFARALKDRAKQIEEVKNLAVICSTNEDERSWVSEEWHTTVFAHFLVEGLRGNADGIGENGSKDGRITVAELHHYLQENVSRWAESNRNARQTPVLIGAPAARGMELMSELVSASDRAKPADPAKEPQSFKVPEELASAWRTHHALEKDAPPPTAYAPHVWRRYQDTLLRYEQLLRAGAAHRALQLKKQLDALQADLAKARTLELTSAQTSLVFPDALALDSPWNDKDLNVRFDELWKAPLVERDPRWEKMQKEQPDKWLRLRLRLKLSGLLLEQAARSPGEDLRKAVELLKVLNGSGNQKPAEVHFLAMLKRDLTEASRPPDELIGNAIRLRRLAEAAALATLVDQSTAKARVHPYSEQVTPWLKEGVVEADGHRRIGQDLLFATDKDSWGLAQDELKKARDLYDAVLADAAVLRKALTTRDEVLLALPYFARWLAVRRNTEEAQLKTIEDLCADTQYLVKVLENPKRVRITGKEALDANDRAPRSVAEVTDDVRKKFREFQEEFNAACLKASSNVALQSVWREMDELLVVPAIDPEVRRTLLENARETSLKFYRETIGQKLSPNSGISADQNADLARKEAKRNGRMAIAVLGERWYDDKLFKADGNLMKTKGRLDDFEVAEHWFTSALVAGHEIGLRWRRLADEINDLTEKARLANLKDALQTLRDADRYSRQLDGGTVKLLNPDVNPATELRKILTHDLLLWHAERSRLDHWFAEDPDPLSEPYYRTAGNVCVADARALVEGPKDSRDGAGALSRWRERLEAVTATEALLKQPSDLVAEVADERSLDVTSERHVSVSYTVKSRGPLPPGNPVVWVQAGPFLEALNDVGRRVVSINAKQEAVTVPLELNTIREAKPPKAPQIDRSGSTLRGLYRGQRLEKAAPILIHRMPEIVVYDQPSAPGAALAVRADEKIHDEYAPSNGSIAIVLDCSGSMWENGPLGPNGAAQRRAQWTRNLPCRYHEATQALRKVLQDVPEGTSVSLFVFSHQQGVNIQANPNPKPEDFVELIRKPKAWSRQDLDPLMNEVEGLTPYYETPIVRSMFRAKREGFDTSLKGFRTMLVLTDGMDNLFKDDAPLHKVHGTKDITEFLHREFKDFGLVVNFVGFKVEGKEQDALQDQFKKAVEEMQLPGKLYLVDDAKLLAEKLRADIRQQIRFKIEDDKGQLIPSPNENGWDVSRNSGVNHDSDQWVSLKPGNYVVQVQTDKIYRQPVQLGRGDYLLINFSGAAFNRIPFGLDVRSVAQKEVSGWLLAILQNQYKMDKLDQSLELMATLEGNARSFSGGTLLQPRPRRVWMEVKPQELPEATTGLRWGPLPGYPAPAWGMKAFAWPRKPGTTQPTNPALTVWWSSDEIVWDGILTPERGLNLENAFRNKEIPVGQDLGSKALIESVQLEDHDVEVSPGEIKSQPCLVVRVSYPRGKPVWVEQDGLDVRGHEHHFYPPAGKYTGYFWPVERGITPELIKELRVVSIERFKSRAIKAMTVIELRPQGRPDNDGRPQSIQDLLQKTGK